MPIEALATIEKNASSINYYPDGGGYKLSQRIADIHGVDPSCVTLGNGSNDILELVTRAFLTPDHSAIYSEYSFAVYPIVMTLTRRLIVLSGNLLQANIETAQVLGSAIAKRHRAERSVRALPSRILPTQSKTPVDRSPAAICRSAHDRPLDRK